MDVTKFIAASVALALLAACVPPPRSPEQPAPPQPPKATESGAAWEPATAEPLLSTDTGSTERLLSTGVIEIGHRDAPLTLLSFTEHHCRYCREFFREQLPTIQRDFIDKGLLRYQVVILPLKKYPQSRDAAAGLLCGALQGKGMAMHALLFEREQKDPASLAAAAEELALDTEAFGACLAAEESRRLLEEHETWARSLSVSLVPTFFLGGQKFVGLPSWAEMRGRIERALREANESDPDS